MKKIVVLTGAGMSAESGISTFRDSNGLWENHRVEDVATPLGWKINPALVLEFYNQRRKQLKSVEPNEAHVAIKELESGYDVTVITQNVDNLHERAGSKNIIHLHGELTKARSTGDETMIYDWDGDLVLGDLCENGYQLRPHIVWFGEMVPMLDVAATHCNAADICIIIGTSMQVYPAAGLVSYVPASHPIIYIDPNPNVSFELGGLSGLEVISSKATFGVPKLVEKLLKDIE